MDINTRYKILQNFASPVVAVTTEHGGEVNGMIANSAGRASLIPEICRLSFYCFKKHHSHELIRKSNKFCMHILSENQLDTVTQLGFETGKVKNKMEDLKWTPGQNGVPILEHNYGFFNCKVVNSMDAGPSTYFLGEAVEWGITEDYDQQKIMYSDYLRDNLSDQWKKKYVENKQIIQDWARKNSEINAK